MIIAPDKPTASVRKSSLRVSNELLGVGVWIVQIALAKLCDRVVALYLLGMGLVYKSMLSKLVSEPAGNMVHRRRGRALLLPQRESNGRWGKSNSHPVEQGENRLVGLGHPRDPHRRH